MNQIKILRQAQIPKMSQERLGQLAGVGRSTVAMWECGKSEPAIDTLVRLAEIFGVSTDTVLGRTEAAKKTAPLSGDGIKVPAEYARLTPANREIVDRLIADLAKSQSND